MALTSAPYGLKPVKLIGGQQFAGQIREIKMTTNSSAGIFNGDLVNIASGQPTAVTATPTTTANSNTPVGVCVGVRYTPPGFGEQHAQYLPANAITNGYLNVWIKVVDDPDCLFLVQADGAVARSNIGKNAPLGNFSAQSTTTGNSKIQLVSASIATTNTLAVRIVDMLENGASTAGDTYTDVYVKFNQGVHAYQNATGA
jgi:hypothetical protein